MITDAGRPGRGPGCLGSPSCSHLYFLTLSFWQGSLFEMFTLQLAYSTFDRDLNVLVCAYKLHVYEELPICVTVYSLAVLHVVTQLLQSTDLALCPPHLTSPPWLQRTGVGWPPSRCSKQTGLIRGWAALWFRTLGDSLLSAGLCWRSAACRW